MSEICTTSTKPNTSFSPEVARRSQPGVSPSPSTTTRRAGSSVESVCFTQRACGLTTRRAVWPFFCHPPSAHNLLVSVQRASERASEKSSPPTHPRLGVVDRSAGRHRQTLTDTHTPQVSVVGPSASRPAGQQPPPACLPIDRPRRVEGFQCYPRTYPR